MIQNLLQTNVNEARDLFSFRLLYGGTISYAMLLGLSVVGVYLMKGERVPDRLLMMLPAV